MRSFCDGGTTVGNENYTEGGGWEQLEIDGPMREHIECTEGYVNMYDNSGDDGRPPIPRLRRKRRVQPITSRFL